MASLNRPGGNITGVTPFSRQLSPKRLGLLQTVVPTAAVIAVLVNRNELDFELQLSEIEEAGRTVGVRILPLRISNERDFEAAFATLISERAGALLIVGGAFINSHRVELAVLTARHAVPAIHTTREFPMAGGLMSYGSDITDAYRQAGVYVGRILKGDKPADLPVLQPTKFRAGYQSQDRQGARPGNVPPTLLALADEVIE